MSKEKKTKKAKNLTSSILAAVGIIALGSVVASGAALGAMAQGFKVAGETVRKTLEEEGLASGKEPEEEDFEEEPDEEQLAEDK